MILNFNNDYMDENSLRISGNSRGFNFGEGFFTTIKVKNYVIEHLNLHLKRLEESLDFFDFDLNMDNFETIILGLLKLNKLSSARIKISIFKERGNVSFIIFCGNLIENLETHSLKISEYVRGNNPIFKYKSLNYYSNLIGKDTLFIDFKNRVLETGIANIFFIKGNRIYTPKSEFSLLNGVYREFLLSLKPNKNYLIEENEIFIDDISEFDSAFITNSIRGIEPIEEIGSKKFDIDPVLKYRDYINERTI